MNLKKIPGSAGMQLSAALVLVHEFDSKKPNISDCRQFVLREGKTFGRVATYWTFLNQHTKEIHHHALTLRTLRKRRDGWYEDEMHRFHITDDENQDEIQRLLNSLAVWTEFSTAGEYLMINTDGVNKDLGEMLASIADSEKSLNLISMILNWVNEDKTANAGLIKLASDNPNRTKSLVAALNFGLYEKRLLKFNTMIEQNLPEKEYQDFLQDNFWIFGSEYSQLLPRSLVLGDQLDFPMRRTVDGYLDIIEIKTPLNGRSPLNFDSSHKNYYANAELSKALGQVETYISNLESEKHRIETKFNIRIEKVRGIIIIGRNESENHLQALRIHNGNRHVQVITFDQLASIGNQILQIMISENPRLTDNY